MKRIGRLWPAVVDFENLLRAYRKARSGKNSRHEVTAFSLNLERELLDLKRELVGGAYRPGVYRQFRIYERKPRIISAAPFRDRVVHHALMNVLEPLLDSRFIADCYACRKGKGVHAAVDRYQGWAKRYRYAMKLDIQRYFPSIDHRRLKEKVARRIKDVPVLNLLTSIIDSGVTDSDAYRWFPSDDLFTRFDRPCGLPIGNLTSQFLANLYLDDFDHFIQDELKLPAYLRYVDDMIILADDPATLWSAREAFEARLSVERLRIHPNRAQVQRTSDGVDVLGYRVFPLFRRLRNENGFRFGRRLRTLARAYKEHRVAWERVDASVQSWIGHASHADTLGLRKRLLSRTVFSRGPCP